MKQAEIARLIDHTLLRPEATPGDIEGLCDDAGRYGFAAVCVNPGYARLASERLEGSGVAVCIVVGFPLGATTTAVKVFEARQAMADGASEIDMVIHVGALKARQYEYVLQDVAGVVQACHARGAHLKVIIEAAMLTDEEKVAACYLSQEAGADFVKTSTGFGPGGATLEDVALMRRVVGPTMGVKAAGGIRSYEDAQKMVAAGASRIGASASVKIMQEAGT